MNDSQNENKDSVLRIIFLNSLKISFIILVYFYISEYFGSLSTPFMASTEFSVQFSMTLLVYTFLSILSGPYIAFVSGFFAESLYQLAFYDDINLGWSLIVAIFGIISSIYKYEPLKFEKKEKIILLMILLSVSSLITTLNIVIIQSLQDPALVEKSNVILNISFSFIVMSIISVIFLIPLLLFAYDKALAKKERFVYNELLTHHPISASDHAFHLDFGRTRLYFCSRCSGVIIGGLFTMFSTHVYEIINQEEFSSELAILLCVLLPIPGLIDWGTQRLLLRKSTTESRLFTGFIIGTALHLMSFTNKYPYFMLFLVILYFGILFLLMYTGHKKEIRLLNNDMTELMAEKKD